jgi:hypothetical protein
MRTTVDIEQRLLERAKTLALRDHKTLSAVIDAALAAYLGQRRTAAKDEPFEVLVRGSSKARFPSPAEISAVEEDDDVAAVRGARRVAP